MPFGVRVYPEGEVASVDEGLVIFAPVGGAILFLVGSSSLWFHCFIVANLGAYATRPLVSIKDWILPSTIKQTTAIAIEIEQQSRHLWLS